MSIIIRLGKEEERSLFTNHPESGSDPTERMRPVWDAVRETFPGMNSVVRVEGPNGTLIAQNGGQDEGELLTGTALQIAEELKQLEAAQREPGMAFGVLQGKGQLPLEFRGLSYRGQAAIAARRAAERKVSCLGGHPHAESEE